MKKENILKSVKDSEIKLLEKHDPKEFFKERTGLWIWSSFINNVVEKAKSTKSGATFKISSFDLVESATDEEIEKDFPKKHLFTETEVCAIIASLIEKQSKGEAGTLLNNGYANLFYTKSRVVGVDWDGSRWDVIGWYRGGLAWHEGDRVFSSATEI